MKIYLDQNKWIDIARSISKPEENQRYVDVSKKIIEKSNLGEWVFPISIIHFIETQSRADFDSRVNLAKVISDISKNHSIKPFIDTEKIEFINFFSELLNLDFRVDVNAVQKKLLPAISADSFDLKFSMEVPVEIKEKINEIAKSIIDGDGLFLHLMSAIEDRDLIREIHEDDSKSKKDWEETREKLLRLPRKDRYKVFLVDCFNSKLFSHIDSAVSIFRKTKRELAELTLANNPKDTQRILESVPSLHVHINLMFEVMRNPQREIHLHDNRDVAFLSTAIPYCDIVITEKTWKHAANSQKLCSKYSTVVESDLNYLLEID